MTTTRAQPSRTGTPAPDTTPAAATCTGRIRAQVPAAVPLPPGGHAHTADSSASARRCTPGRPPQPRTKRRRPPRDGT